jgi:1,4-alpha-glucan branching enzyme
MDNMLSLFSVNELRDFSWGCHFHLYEKMGAHLAKVNGTEGAFFSVWAPHADAVSVIGDFNGWDENKHPLILIEGFGVWTAFIPSANKGQKYKFAIRPRGSSRRIHKADPYALYAEVPSKTASIIWDLDYSWSDQKWMENRRHTQSMDQPFSIYEMHLGSWRRKDGAFLSYRELSEVLPDYLTEQGFTHVEFLPIMEHPFYGSWGYQITSYFAPTSRYGTPQDFMSLVDSLHKKNIGVFLDWVPSHFPTDDYALARFDGSPLYEYSDPQKAYHPDWKSLIFDYGKNEVRSFLISNAMYWLKYFHIDGLRVDAVASMLYLDYSRKAGEWQPNRYGGHENIEAIDFLKVLNKALYGNFPDVQIIAEESTAWPMVSRPTYIGGLGFGMKWDMGWMHDTLSYFSHDSIYRKYHQNLLTFRMIYAFSENFVLSLSHDEVVHGKRSLLEKMPGDEWQKFANLRCLYSLLYAQPGKKLLFMGGEFGQIREWNHEAELDWPLLERPLHRGLQKLLRDLNHVYTQEPALHKNDFRAEGFQWLDHSDADQSVISFFRKLTEKDLVLAVFNLTPIPRENYILGVPQSGTWRTLINSDSSLYGGSGNFQFVEIKTEVRGSHGYDQSLKFHLPPLAAIYLRWQGENHV